MSPSLITRALLALGLALPGIAHAQAYQCTLPQRFDPPREVRQDGPTRRVAVAGYNNASGNNSVSIPININRQPQRKRQMAHTSHTAAATPKRSHA